MVKQVTIENYKSIQKLSFELGRVNVIIGANGVGKSNILEAFLLAASAFQRKLDDEFLANRGIRTSDSKSMKSGFDRKFEKKNIVIKLESSSGESKSSDLEYVADLKRGDEPYEKWENTKDNLNILRESGAAKKNNTMGLSDFLVYYPDIKAMNKDRESNIKPLGIYGEGLLELVKVIKKHRPAEYKGLLEYLGLFDWFSTIEIKDDVKQDLLNGGDIQIYDRYLEEGLRYFDQRSVNEGFLFVLLYYLLFTSELTPKFFAVDNVDTSLNPRLCTRLMKDIVTFSKEHNKQTILTTHNPTLLDGLDLFDDSQRLFIAYRNADGETKLNRMEPLLPKDRVTVKNSEAFIRGHFGGLPKNF